MRRAGSLTHEMLDANTPFVRVVVINFDGGPVTLRCIDALLATDYPQERLQIVLVDNASIDGLNWVIKREYPSVVLIESDQNEGFARGCNIGIGDLHGVDMIALINNDAVVAPDWLIRLQSGFTDERVGAVVPKLLLNLSARAVFVRSERLDTDDEGRYVGVRVESLEINGRDQMNREDSLAQFDERFWPDGGWTKAPVASIWWESQAAASTDNVRVRLSSREPMSVTIGELGNEVDVLVGPTPVTVDLLVEHERRIINSAGGALFGGWSGGDLGFLEPDIGQYDEPTEVFSWCGAAVLMKSSYLLDVGRFDPTYFLYYEDFDLSWRGRTAGWTYRYMPSVVVFHEHAFSSGAGSAFFRYWVDRNRRLTLVKNAPASVAWRAVIGSGARVAIDLAHHALSQARRLRPPSPRVVAERLSGYWRFVSALPQALRERRRISRRSVVPREAIAAWTVHK